MRMSLGLMENLDIKKHFMDLECRACIEQAILNVVRFQISVTTGTDKHLGVGRCLTLGIATGLYLHKFNEIFFMYNQYLSLQPKDVFIFDLRAVRTKKKRA